MTKTKSYRCSVCRWPTQRVHPGTCKLCGAPMEAIQSTQETRRLKAKAECDALNAVGDKKGVQ